MKICRWDRWTDIKEDRIDSIDIQEFKKILKEKCHTDQHLYKKIYQPKFKQGIFSKSLKVTESYFGKKQTTNEDTWKAYPIREYSLTCYNYEESGEGVTYLVFPFKDSLFTISPVKESSHDGVVDNYKKGYWKDNIKWLEQLNERELWTESDCLVIEQELYNSIFEEVKTDIVDTDYTLSVRNIIATTLIGEAGGKVAEMKKVMNVLNNRSKRRKTTPSKEALRARQFSMWNSAYEKIGKNWKLKGEKELSNVIKIHKTSNSWKKKHWDLAYQIADANIKAPIADTTSGATLYYAVRLETKVKNPHKPLTPENSKMPYWAKVDKFKETTRTPYHAYGKMV